MPKKYTFTKLIFNFNLLEICVYCMVLPIILFDRVLETDFLTVEDVDNAAAAATLVASFIDMSHSSQPVESKFHFKIYY